MTWPFVKPTLHEVHKLEVKIVKLEVLKLIYLYLFSWQDLKDFMRKAGEVTYGDAHGDCGKNRGLVCFITKSDMERAVDELDGREINGKEVRWENLIFTLFREK